MSDEALTFPVQVMVSRAQSEQLTLLRTRGVVTAAILRRAIDSVLLEYSPLLDGSRSTSREQLSQLGVLGERTRGGAL